MVEFIDRYDRDNIIELRDIHQSYDDGKVQIIEKLDFLVEDKPMQGQFVVLLGMSGCGKSTLLRYIAGLQEPTSGKILVNNKPVGSDNRVGMVFQQYSSFPWMTVLDNVSLALKLHGVSKKERDERAMEMIELVGLAGHEKKYAQYPILSGGQLQRIAIARSLIANPKIVLMDEPFGSLDVETRLNMQDMLLNLWKKFNSTVVFVTHDISEAVYLADDIYIMKKAPSRIVEHIHIDLPEDRSFATKREKIFISYAVEVEERMMSVSRRN